jgi:Ca2+-binding RTX toxin-like protein
VPQIAMASDGSHLVVYERDHGGGDVDVVGKFVNSDGSLGTEFTIDADGENILNPTVAALSNGNFVVAYENEWSGASNNTWIGLKIVTPGTPPTLGGQKFPELLDGTVDQDHPKVAALEGGGFALVYASNQGGTDDIRAAIYDDDGNVVKAPFTVNANLTGAQDEPVVAALHDGGFVVVWDDGNLGVLMGQRFDAAGNEVGSEFVAGSIGQETAPTITVLDDGRFFVGYEQQTGDDDVWGTIFDPREDTIEGTSEADILTAFATGGTVKGRAGDDMLLGTGSSDNLKGGGGSDHLVGMDGNDFLHGGAKKDFFVFAAVLDKDNNVDTVQGFKQKKQKDKLVLLDDIFAAVGDKVDKGEVRVGNKAKDGNDYLIAKVNAGKKKATLFYDEDGSGAGGKVKFAKVEYKGDLNLNHKIFKVVEDIDI